MSILSPVDAAVVAAPASRHAVPSRRFERACKRGLDIVLASLALVVLGIPMILIAIAICIDSRGAALLTQRRVKRHGEIFSFYKFRTMHVAPAVVRLENQHDGPIFKMRDDPRRTRLGKFLRKSSMDELPNLLDVLLGHMSFVGPRPPLPHEVAAYNARELRRLTVKPGITGLWQVSGRSTLSWEETIRLDIQYIESWSFWRDLIIIVRTVPAVLFARGAY